MPVEETATKRVSGDIPVTTTFCSMKHDALERILKLQHAQTQTSIRSIEREMQSTRKLLVGNGEPGVCDMVRQNTAAISSLERKNISLSRKTWELFLKLFVPAVTLLIAIGAYMKTNVIP